MIGDFFNRIGLGGLPQLKEVFQDLQFYIATLLAIFGGIFTWYKTRSAFKKAVRLSDVLIETTGIGTRETPDKPGKFEHYLWIAPLRQLKLGDLFTPLYLKSITHGGRQQAKHDSVVLTLRSHSHTKGMLLRIRSAVKEIWAASDIIAASVPARPNSASPYHAQTFLAFLRRDAWTDDRFQSFRIVLVPKWIVERTAARPEWLEDVIVDVQHQQDRLEHIRFLAGHLTAIEKGPAESGVIAVEFYFEPVLK